jgi:hypothetical protein
MSPPPIDVFAETLNGESPYVFTAEVEVNVTVLGTDPGAIVVDVVEVVVDVEFVVGTAPVVGGESTIGGAGGETTEVEVDESLPATVVDVVPVGAEPRIGSTNPGILPFIVFLPLPETRLVVDSPSSVVVVT